MMTPNEERAIESLIAEPTAIGLFLRACEASAHTETGMDRLMRDISSHGEDDESDIGDRFDGLG
jgi:hypothetical protein